MSWHKEANSLFVLQSSIGKKGFSLKEEPDKICYVMTPLAQARSEYQIASHRAEAAETRAAAAEDQVATAQAETVHAKTELSEAQTLCLSLIDQLKEAQAALEKQERSRSLKPVPSQFPPSTESLVKIGTFAIPKAQKIPEALVKTIQRP